jgi:Domain of unknown function (DUF5666)
MNRGVRIALGVVAVVIIAAGSFFGGAAYGRSRSAAASSGSNGTANSRGQRGFGTAAGSQGGFLGGQIQTIDSGGFTLTDSSGKEVRVNVTSTTLIQEEASVSITDLKQGDTVTVSGSQASDGSITARLVRVGQGGGFGAPPGGTPPSGGPAVATPSSSTNP